MEPSFAQPGGAPGAPRPLHRGPTLLRLAGVLAIGVAVAACTSATSPGWTYAPPTPGPSANAGSGTPEPSTAATSGPSAATSPEPSTAASAAPSASAAASEAPSAAPSAAPSGATAEIHVAAKNIKFDTDQLNVPAGTPFTIVFENQDAGVPHNIAIYQSKGGTLLFRGKTVTGVTTVTYDVPALPAGQLYFQCDVHPTLMFGTVTAG